MRTPDGDAVCATCGCVETAFLDSPGYLGDTHECTDPHSLDNGLGSEPLQTIRELRFNSSLLKNSWQSVLGYYWMGHRDSFVEGCMRELTIALDGVSDEQFVQCRRFLLREIRQLKDRGSGPSRRTARRKVVLRTLEEAAKAWPRVALILKARTDREQESPLVLSGTRSSYR